MNNPTEKRFETHIENALLKQGYLSLSSNEYDKTLCLIPNEVIGFLKRTQPKDWAKLETHYGVDAENKLLKRLNKEISDRGTIDVLRNGIRDLNAKFKLVYFEPKSGLNEEHLRWFKENQLSVIRQLFYSHKNQNSIDMVLFVNGIPILTMELKNKLTNQNIIHSQNQYKKDRNDQSEPLLKFQRCLVHFCVDDDRVSMTTQLRGDKTYFLPYNKDIENPINPNGYRTHYLWEEILTPISLFDIMENFVHLSEEKEKEWDGTKGKIVEKTKSLLVFPRYHQLDVIRKLREKVVEEGSGHYFLIQHTTGAGKSYSIGWLAHMLTSLYRTKNDTKRIFDTIIVITDRKVLDKQLQYTISQLEQTSGVVNNVDKSSAQLMDYLERGKDIIITTIQKFPVISDKISTLKSKTFAIIVDEVHSSQSGETSKHLKKTISHNEDVLETEEELDYEDLIREEIKSRGKQDNLSFFGFTGTPKNKTLELFGRKDDNGIYRSFHTYSMKQSISEGFTLDVLQNYTTYKRWFKLVQKNGEDQQLPEGKVKKEMISFVDSHTETISQKVSIILDQFINKTSKTILGRGRAMVIVRSRFHCVLFQQELKSQMKAKNLSYSCLVAFSGTIHHNGRDFTEDVLNQENGLENKISIAEAFKDPKYRILIVSNKFQTGFDEPLLHSMFVDKKLNGVQCVQTLSRLNRTTSNKDNTFILDFVNDVEDIVNSFQPFYTSTIMAGETDPNKLYGIETKLKSFHLFTPNDINDFCKIFYDEKITTDERLQPILNDVVGKWEDLEQDKQQDFKTTTSSYLKMYAYISQIFSFEDIELEKMYVFLKYVYKKFPPPGNERLNIFDAIDLDALRIQKIAEHKLSLEDRIGEIEPLSAEGGGKILEEALDFLSEILEKINKTFGMELSEEHKISVRKVSEQVFESEELKKVMSGDNSEQNKKKKVEEILIRTLLGYVNNQFDFYKKMENPQMVNLLTNMIYNNFYQRNNLF
jgi:type I restriction enzyme, R subunit